MLFIIQKVHAPVKNDWHIGEKLHPMLTCTNNIEYVQADGMSLN